MKTLNLNQKFDKAFLKQLSKDYQGKNYQAVITQLLDKITPAKYVILNISSRLEEIGNNMRVFGYMVEKNVKAFNEMTETDKEVLEATPATNQKNLSYVSECPEPVFLKYFHYMIDDAPIFSLLTERFNAGDRQAVECRTTEPGGKVRSEIAYTFKNPAELAAKLLDDCGLAATVKVNQSSHETGKI